MVRALRIWVVLIALVSLTVWVSWRGAALASNMVLGEVSVQWLGWQFHSSIAALLVLLIFILLATRILLALVASIIGVPLGWRLRMQHSARVREETRLAAAVAQGLMGNRARVALLMRRLSRRYRSTHAHSIADILDAWLVATQGMADDDGNKTAPDDQQPTESMFTRWRNTALPLDLRAFAYWGLLRKLPPDDEAKTVLKEAAQAYEQQDFALVDRLLRTYLAAGDVEAAERLLPHYQKLAANRGAPLVALPDADALGFAVISALAEQNKAGFARAAALDTRGFGLWARALLPSTDEVYSAAASDKTQVLALKRSFHAALKAGREVAPLDWQDVLEVLIAQDGAATAMAEVLACDDGSAEFALRAAEACVAHALWGIARQSLDRARGLSPSEAQQIRIAVAGIRLESNEAGAETLTAEYAQWLSPWLGQAAEQKAADA